MFSPLFILKNQQREEKKIRIYINHVKYAKRIKNVYMW